MRYEKRADPFYKSAMWRRARRMALERDHYLCQDCMRRYLAREVRQIRTATVVHHIQPREEHPELALELDNLISLCEICHNRRHPEKGGNRYETTEDRRPTRARVIKV
jgi:5-methylcytosine-specific restriction endonuclease McrA